MSTNENRTRLGVQLIALLLSMVSFLCCMCGWLYSAAAWMSNVPIDDNGQRVPDAFDQQMVFLNGYLFTIVALMLLLFGVAILFFYGRKKPHNNKGFKVLATFLFIGSLGCCLWSGLVYLSFPVMQLIFSIEDEFALIMSILPTLFCIILSVFLGLVGGLIWFLSNREQRSELDHNN